MDSKNSERDIWLTYCEECVKSKIIRERLNHELERTCESSSEIYESR